MAHHSIRAVDKVSCQPSPVNFLLTKAFDGTGRNTNNSWTDTAGLSKETRVDVVVSTRSTFARHISCHNRITHTHTEMWGSKTRRPFTSGESDGPP